MSKDKDDVQISLRIPTELKEKIESYAKSNHRSFNAEAILQLTKTISSQDLAGADILVAIEKMLFQNSSTRKEVISQRLKILLAEINDTTNAPLGIKPVHIAKSIGEDYATLMEDWFLGRQEPSFSQLEKIADYFGSNPNWLLFGDGTPFLIEHSRVPESMDEGIEWFITSAHKDRHITHVSFLREKSNGGLMIIKRYGRWGCEVFTTPYYLHTSIGNGGFSSLASLFVLWQKFYKVYAKTSGLIVNSYLVNSTDFTNIYNGNHHPLKTLKKMSSSCWWEDIWDKKMPNSYWEGYLELRETVFEYINSRSYLKKEVELMNSETVE